MAGEFVAHKDSQCSHKSCTIFTSQDGPMTGLAVATEPLCFNSAKVLPRPKFCLGSRLAQPPGTGGNTPTPHPGRLSLHSGGSGGARAHASGGARAVRGACPGCSPCWPGAPSGSSWPPGAWPAAARGPAPGAGSGGACQSRAQRPHLPRGTWSGGGGASRTVGSTGHSHGRGRAAGTDMGLAPAFSPRGMPRDRPPSVSGAATVCCLAQ